ncbi:terminase large subunit domain-containing protein [Novosphingopyxis sp. YJ-S2-01]|uniref:terminase large subunit domain-containing protein n=1 Tax=Novosphingopyxis sp. YJ-S2-01 TaxID=2794021 RepID=UPI0018DC8969|nr:terminase family protein [Novosphingopyxis sp. YJ-S2-01]MBH9537881.1 oxidoreductase [Novosphingopyxis sp. YJ-S2-01]
MSETATLPSSPEAEGDAEALRDDYYREARSLYWRGWRVTQIARELGLKRSSVQSWRDRHKWHEAPAIRWMEESLQARFCTLVEKDKKTGGDIKEIDLLGRQAERLARIRRFEQPGGHEGHLNPEVSKRNKAARAKLKANHFNEAQVAELRALLEDLAFEYQLRWWENRSRRTRMILKSRQIGATYFFALEALVTALETGNNQIFLSASKAQAHIFKNYIAQFGAKVGVALKGDPMIVTSELVDEGKTGIELHFLGTNARTAQGYHGDFYFDEFFWVFGFEQLNKVASGMAMQKKYRRTYMSTPSTVGHEAYPYWTGERKNRNRKKADRLSIDVSHEALQAGRLCEDKVWRQIVTIDDAEAGGCDLFDIDELRDDYAPDEYANLLLCQFVDDSLSAFSFNQLVRCHCDSWVEWDGFEPLKDRPVGNRAVWAGYDPQESEQGDNAALVIALPPEAPGGKFRVIERHQLRGFDFQQQSAFIKGVFAKYNVTYFGIDATGVGAAVYQLVRDWFPRVTKIEYSLEAKQRLVMKAQNVIRTGRIQWDAGWTDIAQSFLAIKKVLTPRGGQLTYKADRSKETGHADVAWSIMHILDNEPLDGKPKARSTIEILGGDDGR